MKLFNFRSSNILAIIILSIVLFLIGLTINITLTTPKIIEKLKNDNSIIIELKDSVLTEEINEITQYLHTLESINRSSIKYISKIDGLKSMEGEIELNLLDGVNPLSDMIIFRPIVNEASDTKLNHLTNNISSRYNAISSTYHEYDSSQDIARNLMYISNTIFILALFFLGLGLIVIYNTIKLNLITRSEEIKLMFIVGADFSFIRQPFIKQSMIIASVSIMLSSIFLSILHISLYQYFLFYKEISQYFIFFISLLVIIIIGLGIPIISTFSIVSKYIKDSITRA